MRQRAPVSSRIAAPPASGSTTRRSAETRSRTSGSSSRPPEPDDLDRQVPRAQRRGELGHVGAAPHEDRAGGGRVAAVHGGPPAVGDGVGEPGPLGRHVVVQGDADVAGLGAR